MAENPDLSLGVRFYIEAEPHPRKSKEEGRPVFFDREMVHIRFPADNKRDLKAPAHEMHYVSHLKRQVTYAERFPDVYRAFKEDQADMVQGTPLSELPALTESQRASFKAQKIQTVEQLANLPDPAIKRLGMGARPAVEAAQVYLSKAGELGEIARLKAENEALKAQIKPKPATKDIADEFEGMTDDDLRNMLADAGVEADGRWGRKRLVSELQDLAAKATEAA